MNRLLFGTLALGVMLCVLFVQSDATQLPVPQEQLSVPEPQAADTSAPAAATAETDEYETVTVYRTEYRDVRVCDGPGLPCRVVRQAVRVPVQVTRKVAKAAAKTAATVVKSAACACGCGGTCGGTCGCADCTCMAPAAGVAAGFHSVPVVRQSVTYGSTGTSAGAYAAYGSTGTSSGAYSTYTTYQPAQTRRVAWRPLRRLLGARGGCR